MVIGINGDIKKQSCAMQNAYEMGKKSKITKSAVHMSCTFCLDNMKKITKIL